MEALPYLREISLKRDQVESFDQYPFSIPAVRELDSLSPTRQLAVLSRIRQLVQDSSQFIIATHSPILLAYPGALIYQIDSSGISPVRYQDTEHYEVTKAFLDNPARMLEELFRDE